MPNLRLNARPHVGSVSHAWVRRLAERTRTVRGIEQLARFFISGLSALIRNYLAVVDMTDFRGSHLITTGVAPTWRSDHPVAELTVTHISIPRVAARAFLGARGRSSSGIS